VSDGGKNPRGDGNHGGLGFGTNANKKLIGLEGSSRSRQDLQKIAITLSWHSFVELPQIESQLVNGDFLSCFWFFICIFQPRSDIVRGYI
jgi:hypothetical protein